MDRIIGLIIQFVWLLLALVIPGGLVVMAIAWVLKLLKLKPPLLPLRREDGGLYTMEDWRRDARAARPIRWWFTETLPGFFRRIAERWKGGEEEMDVQEEILHGAFEGLTRWVEENSGQFVEDVHAADGPLEIARRARLAEIFMLNHWWTEERDAEIERIALLPKDEREHWEESLEQEEQLALARLANVWRDLT